MTTLRSTSGESRRLAIGLLALLATATTVFATEPPTVFVSIPPQKFIVEHIAGDGVAVQVMLPPGASPATYEPTPRQMAALNRAVLYFQIGAPFEGPVVARISTLMPDLEIVDCRTGIILEAMDHAAHGHGTDHPDPHIWLDPNRMQIVARTMAAALHRAMPENATTIEENLNQLLTAIDSVDQRISSALAPFAGRDVLVFHPAYGYFTRRYNLVQIAVESEGKAPSARQLAKIVDGLGDQETAAIFVQPQFSQTTAQRLADALGCRLVELDPLAEDYLRNLEEMARRIANVLGG